jgi:hypothetical protein
MTIVSTRASSRRCPLSPRSIFQQRDVPLLLGVNATVVSFGVAKFRGE